MPENLEKLRGLHTGVSKHLNVGEFEPFVKGMQDPQRRSRFYKEVSKRVDIGSSVAFEEKITSSLKTPTSAIEVPGKLGSRFMQKVYETSAGTFGAMDSWSKWLSEKTGLERGGVFGELAKSQEHYAEYFKERALQPDEASGLLAVSDYIYGGIGSASMAVPLIMSVGLPAYSAIHGGAAAIDADESALKGAAIGYAEGLMLHGILKGVGIMRLPERAAAGGAVFGGMALQEELKKAPEERDYNKVVGEFFVGSGLLLAGKGKMTTMDVIKEAKRVYGRDKIDKTLKELENLVMVEEAKPPEEMKLPIEYKSKKVVAVKKPVEKVIEKPAIEDMERVVEEVKKEAKSEVTGESYKFEIRPEDRNTLRERGLSEGEIDAIDSVDTLLGELGRSAKEEVAEPVKPGIKKTFTEPKKGKVTLSKRLPDKEKTVFQRPITKLEPMSSERFNKIVEESKRKGAFEEEDLMGREEVRLPKGEGIKGLPESMRKSLRELGEKGEDNITEFHAGLSALMPSSIRKRISKAFEKPKGIAKASRDIVNDYWGKRWGLEFKYSDKWLRELKDKFSKSELEDAMFYRQKTGNLWKGKGDIFEDVKSRTPKNLKEFVDGEVDEHIRNWRRFWNESPHTKDIVAREEVIKTYLTGVYSNPPDKIGEVYDRLVGIKGRQFVTTNFMRNRKHYLNFAEAFEKAGLVPRFRSIADQLNYQDAYMIRLFANNELIGKIHELEKEIGQKLIVRGNSKFYDEAKLLKDEDSKNLYVPFDDYFLRGYVVGKKKDGKPIWNTSKVPALVHKDLASAVISVFNKDAYSPSNILGRTYDKVGSFLRYMRVTFSGFHFTPLTESLVGGKGAKVLDLRGWKNFGTKLLRDTEYMTEVKEAGLILRAPSEASRHQIEGGVEKIINRLEARGGVAKAIGKGADLVTKVPFGITHLLFDKYHPLLKTMMYHDYKFAELAKLEKLGIRFTERQIKELNKEIASTVNDQFGSQAWEMIRYLNDPKIRLWMHRLIGYPDWTISALRQAGAIGEGGVRGELARRYWLRYGIAFLATQQAISYLNTGFYNDEEGNVKWSWDKSHNTFENKDPSLKHKIDFQLPDVKLPLPFGLGTYNPGRELREDGTYGRRKYSHFGKQMLEIPRYALYTTEQMFAKANPVLQMGFTQIAGGSPYDGGIFPARGEFIGGEFKSWKGEKGIERLRERALQIITDATPFSIQAMWTTGPATAGMIPISMGTSTHAAGSYIEKALEEGNGVELVKIVEALLDNNYKTSSIKRTITTISNRILEKERTELLK